MFEEVMNQNREGLIMLRMQEAKAGLNWECRGCEKPKPKSHQKPLKPTRSRKAKKPKGGGEKKKQENKYRSGCKGRFQKVPLLIWSPYLPRRETSKRKSLPNPPKIPEFSVPRDCSESGPI